MSQRQRAERSKYRVVLLAHEGFEIGEREADTIKEAKQHVAYLLSDEYATACETTHESLGTWKVEIRDTNDNCIHDEFR